MGDIIDPEEVDRDTVDSKVIEQQFSQRCKLIAETTVSLKKAYINKLHGTKSHKLAVSLSDNSIELYELNKASLTRLCRLSGHKKALTEVVFCPKEENLLYSSAQDGLIKLWDTRTGGSCVQEYKDDDDQLQKQYECMDVSCNGRVLCAGSQLAENDAYLVFWDNRNVKPLGGYWNSHTEDITQVKFHKQKTEILASGSLDGLLNIYNILEPNEDDALTYSLNVENSVEKLSWIDEKRLAAITQSNDLQVWDVDSGELLKTYSRDKVARTIKRSKGDDCYLVDVYTNVEDTPVLLAGSYGGNGGVLRSVLLTDRKLQPCTNFVGNKQTVRCCHYNKLSDTLVTAGESGVVSVWGAEGEERAPHKLTSSLNRLHVHRHKPY